MNENNKSRSSANINSGTANKKSHGRRRVSLTKDGFVALAELLLIVLVLALIAVLVIKSIASRNESAGKKPKYVALEIPTEEYREGTLILVNPEHEYSFPAKMTENLVNLYAVKVRNPYFSLRDASVSASSAVASQLAKLCRDMVRENEETLGGFTTGEGDVVCDKLLISSAYRSKEYQAELVRYFASEESAGAIHRTMFAAGFSEHHTGLAFDIKIYTYDEKTADLRTNEQSWIDKNACTYGFVHRYARDKAELTKNPAEDYHFRFVDIPHAEIMTSGGMCLEEYLEYLTGFSPDGEPLSVTCDSGKFMIYYVPASDGQTTEIPVPKKSERVDFFAVQDKISAGMYTVSGDNKGGFIVTVAM